MALTIEELKTWREHYRAAVASSRLERYHTTSWKQCQRELQRVERRIRILTVRRDHGAEAASLDHGSRKAWAGRMRCKVKA